MSQVFERVVFDLDDTLIDRSGALQAAALELLGERPDARWHLPQVDSVAGLARAIQTETPELSRLPLQALSGQLREGLLRHLKPDDKLRRMLRSLRSCYRLVLATNGSRSMQRQKLLRAGLDYAFDEVHVSGEIGCRKPAPSFYARARGETDYSRVLFVGDDPLLDIAPPQELGARAFWVSRCRRYPEALPEPWFSGVTVLELAGRLPC